MGSYNVGLMGQRHTGSGHMESDHMGSGAYWVKGSGSMDVTK